MADSVALITEVTPTSLALFGMPPLLEGEDAAAYDEMVAQVSAAVSPADILEHIWVRDVVDLTWEILRLRRIKMQLLTANLHRGLKVILDPLCGYEEAGELSSGWASREEDAVERVNSLLATAGLTMNEIIAETLAEKINEIERIDRQIMNQGARRNAALREVDRHRVSLGEMLRRSTNDVEEAEFVEIEQLQINDESAAVDNESIVTETVTDDESVE